MRRLFCFVFMLVLLSLKPILAQETSSGDIISFGVSINTFKMQALKQQSEDLLSAFPVDNAKITSSFPPYFGYELSYRKKLNNQLYVGGLIHYTSTGSRLSYSDFTGTLNIDLLLDYYSVGALGSSELINNEKIKLFFDLKASIIYTNYKIKTYFRIGDDSDTDGNTNFYSIGLGIQPGCTFFYNINKFKIGSNLGLEGNINGKLKVGGQKGFVVDNNNKPVKVDWTGIRFGLILGYTL